MSSDHATESASLIWFKSSRSGPEGGDCVEVAAVRETVHVRDSKDRTGPHVSVGAAHWTAFITFAAQ